MVTEFCILSYRMAFRSLEVGTDLVRYKARYLFSYRANDTYELLDEPCYKFINRVCYAINSEDGFRILLILISVFTVGTFVYITYLYSKDQLVSCMAYLAFEFYLFGFSGLRQAIAMSFVMWAFHFCAKKKLVLFALMVAIAVGFHRTSIVFLACYFAKHFKWNKQRIILIIVIFLFLIPRISDIGDFIIEYFSGGFEEFSSSGSFGTISFIILLLIIAEFMFNNPIKNKENENVLINNIMLGAFFIQLLSSISYNFSRLNLYFFQFVVIYLPNIVYNVDSKNNLIKFSKDSKKYLFFGLVVVLVYIYYVRLQGEPYGILPYKYMWSRI